jgi:hypothetical protein
LTGVVMDGVNRWRRSVDTTFSHPNRLTRDAVRYTVDRDLIGKVTTVCEASAAVFVLPLQSTWMKYSFGDGMQTRLPGDVGVDAYFADQTTLKIPNAHAISYTGFGSPGAGDKVPSRDARNIARLAARGYQRNTGTPGMTAGSARWGVFEVKAGDKALNGWTNHPGIWARPPRVVASVGRKRIAKAIKAGRMSAPTTEFSFILAHTKLARGFDEPAVLILRRQLFCASKNRGNRENNVLLSMPGLRVRTRRNGPGSMAVQRCRRIGL